VFIHAEGYFDRLRDVLGTVDAHTQKLVDFIKPTFIFLPNFFIPYLINELDYAVWFLRLTTILIETKHRSDHEILDHCLHARLIVDIAGEI
jgi:hypothetical protein